MKKRMIALALIAAMSVITLSGCSSKAKDPGTGSKTEAGKKDDTKVETGGETGDTNGLPELPNNTLAISVSVPTFGTDPKGTAVQDEWQKRMEEYLGCKLDITWNYTPWADYRETEKVVLASGDIPDAFTYSWGDSINEYGQDGQVLDIAQYKDYLTYYSEFVKETVGGEAFAYNADGTSYFFKDGFVNDDDIVGAQSFTAFAYRFDILEKHGLVPATTTEEFVELAGKLKDLYPGQYVISNSDKNYPFYRGFVGIFHTWDTLYWNGTEWAFGPIEDNFKEMLKYIKSLYDAGYVDPEFATDDGDRSTTKAVTGKTLIYPTLWAGMAAHWNNNTEDPNIKFGLAYLPKNADYGTPWKWGSKQDGLSLSSSGMGVGISAKTKYPEWVVKLVDYQYSPEMIELQNWGIEGVTYTVAADGTKTFTDEILKAENPVQALANYGVTSSAACRTGIVFTPQDFLPQITQIPTEPWWDATDGYTENKYWVASSKYGGLDSVSPADRAPIVRLDADQATERATLINSSQTVAQEKALQFITGQLDIDKDWDAYVDAVKFSVDDFEGTINMLNENTVK